MNVFRLLLRESPWLVVGATAAGLFSGLAGVALLALIQRLLAAGAGTTFLAAPAYMGWCLLLFAGQVISQNLLLHLAQTTSMRMRIRLSSHLLAAPLRVLEQVGPPKLMAALTEDVGTIANAIGYFPVLATNCTLLLGCLIYMAFLDWRAFLWILLFLLCGVATHQVLVFAALRFIQRGRAAQSSLYEHFRALTEGTKELKTHRGRREAFLRDCLGAASERFRHLQTTGVGIYNVAGSWAQLLFFVLIGILLFPLGLPAISPAVRASLLVTVLFLMSPADAILSAFPTLGRAEVALKAVTSLGLSLQAPSQTHLPTAALPTPPDGWLLTLAGVTHSYRDEKSDRVFTLGPIDLTFAPGQLVFLVGGNGSGKTTLLKVLTGLYAPQEGAVRWNGIAIDDRTRESYQELFSVVYSDFFLFEQLLGIEDVRIEERATQYLKALELYPRVSVANNTLSTTALSQGQRKRLALLVAYLEDRPFYVFDEWAADQDPAFKEVFYHHLLPELRDRGKAVVAITHDDRYYSLADRIVKLEAGRVGFDGPLADTSPERRPAG